MQVNPFKSPSFFPVQLLPQRQCPRLSETLERQGVPCAAVHGDKVNSFDLCDGSNLGYEPALSTLGEPAQYGAFHKWGVPQNGWFIWENPTKMDDLGVPLFQETTISLVNHVNPGRGSQRANPQRKTRVASDPGDEASRNDFPLHEFS